MTTYFGKSEKMTKKITDSVYLVPFVTCLPLEVSGLEDLTLNLRIDEVFQFSDVLLKNCGRK